ncbi:Ribosomal RNA-processing protein 7 A [Gaertneriomyces sp. JEL0708]|nr:Ribosomal RNA-processing protein 7 A [Gaertneriomyces sp. JEL0708]
MGKQARANKKKAAGGVARAEKQASPEPAVQPASCPTPPKPTDSFKNASEPLSLFAQFRILPITMPPLSVSAEPLLSFTQHVKSAVTQQDVTHQLYIRAHESRKKASTSSATVEDDEDDGVLPLGRTLFVVNIPADATERHLARLFRRCGRIERVVWHNDHKDLYIPGVHRSGSQAHVVFVEDGAVERAIGMKLRRRVWSAEVEEAPEVESQDGEKQVAQGLAKWISQYLTSRPKLADLQQVTDVSLVAFEDAEREAALEAERRRNMPDEDGFVTVMRGRGRKNMNADGHGASVAATSAEEAKKLKPKKKELVDFYRFQMRESKRNQLADLRRKFEEDKQRIAALKASRRFKPY